MTIALELHMPLLLVCGWGGVNNHMGTRELIICTKKKKNSTFEQSHMLKLVKQFY